MCFCLTSGAAFTAAPLDVSEPGAFYVLIPLSERWLGGIPYITLSTSLEVGGCWTCNLTKRYTNYSVLCSNHIQSLSLEMAQDTRISLFPRCCLCTLVTLWSKGSLSKSLMTMLLPDKVRGKECVFLAVNVEAMFGATPDQNDCY